jgi:hypothetical protein
MMKTVRMFAAVRTEPIAVRQGINPESNSSLTDFIDTELSFSFY